MGKAYNEHDVRKMLTETHVAKTASGCWEWQGCRPDGRYGSIGYLCRYWLTHRLAYLLATGIDPGEFIVMHSCDNPPCVNPAHLSLGTTRDNSKDMMDKGRSTKGRVRPGTGPAGVRNCKAKITPDIVAKIRRDRLDQNLPIRTIAIRYGISKSQAWNIVSGGQWKEIDNAIL